VLARSALLRHGLYASWEQAPHAATPLRFLWPAATVDRKMELQGSYNEHISSMWAFILIAFLRARVCCVCDLS
jgi:hypothetical protein